MLTERDAARWLEQALVDPAQEGAGVAASTAATESPEPLREVAKSIYAWARAYERQLRAEGRCLPPEGEQLLLELYHELKGRRSVSRAG